MTEIRKTAANTKISASTDKSRSDAVADDDDAQTTERLLVELAYEKEVVHMLRNELEEVQAQVHTMTMEREAANKASAMAEVEMRSTHEEPGSTSNKLEKGKEELLVLNEELLSLNDGLKNKIDEIHGVNRDLNFLMNATEIGTIFLDAHLCIKRYTPHVEEILDIAEADLGRPLHHLNHRLRGDGLTDDAARVLRELVVVERELQHSGSQQWFLVRLRPNNTAEGQAVGVVITFINITERRKYDEQIETLIKRLEAMLAERAEQVTQLAFDLSRAEQSERDRIAHILHDDLQQLLHAVRLDMDVLSECISPDQNDVLTQASKLISKAIETTRTLSAELSPPVMKGDEFTISLEWLAIQMEGMHGLKVEVVAPAPILLPAELRSLVYEMVRELLFNVVKHGETDCARVVMGREEDELVLVVSDEGVGFTMEPEQPPSQLRGFGLRSIKQRLGHLGGRLELEAAPGNGTKARMIVPLTKHGNHAASASPKHADS